MYSTAIFSASRKDFSTGAMRTGACTRLYCPATKITANINHPPFASKPGLGILKSPARHFLEDLRFRCAGLRLGTNCNRAAHLIYAGLLPSPRRPLRLLDSNLTDVIHNPAESLTEALLEFLHALLKNLGLSRVKDCDIAADIDKPGLAKIFVVGGLLEMRVVHIRGAEIVFEVCAYFLPDSRNPP